MPSRKHHEHGGLMALVAPPDGEQQDAQRLKVSELLCLRHLDGRPCLSAAQQQLSEQVKVVVLPIPPARPSGSAAAQQEPAPAWPQLTARCHEVASVLREAHIDGARVDDNPRSTPGAKFHAWEAAGVMLRVEVGARELASGAVCLVVHPALAAHLPPEAMLLAQQRGAQRHHVGTPAEGRPQPGQQQHPQQHPRAGQRPLKLSGLSLGQLVEVCLALLRSTTSSAGVPSRPPRGASDEACGRGGAGCLGRCAKVAACDLQHQERQRQGGPGEGGAPDVRCPRLHVWPGANSLGALWSPTTGLPTLWPRSGQGHPSGAHTGAEGGAAAAAGPGAGPALVCVPHVQHLVGLGERCHCQLGHVTLEQLQQEVASRLVEAGRGRVVGWERTEGTSPTCTSTSAHAQRGSVEGAEQQAGPISASPSPPPAAEVPAPAPEATQRGRAQALVVTGIPPHLPAGQVHQALARALAALPSCKAACVKVSRAQGGGSHGWARVALNTACAEGPDGPGTPAQPPLDPGAAVIAALDGTTIEVPTAASIGGQEQAPGRSFTLHLSPSCGRRDTLFANVHSACVRSRLRVDATAAFSVTDATTADDMSAVAHLLAAVAAQHTPGEQQGGALTAVDATACGGGNTAALARTFLGGVMAVELDGDRARDLLHNLRLLRLCPPPQLVGQEPRSCPAELGADPAAVVGQAAGQEDGGSVRVLCGDFLALWRCLAPADCVLIDPPWGGPAYQASGGGDPEGSSSGTQPTDQQDAACSSPAGGCPQGAGLSLGRTPLCALCGMLLGSGQARRAVALKLPASGSVALHTQLLACTAQHAAAQSTRLEEGAGAPPAKLWGVRVPFGHSCLLVFVRVGAGEEGVLPGALRDAMRAWSARCGLSYQGLGTAVCATLPGNAC